MERLKSVYLLAIILTSAAHAIGQQQSTANDHLAAGSVAIIGDVERFQNYALPTDSAVTVREAVVNAGPLSDAVNVTVIRQGRIQWTQFISADDTDSRDSVESGDVLVVHAMSTLTSRVKRNAALITDTGAVVVGLEQEGIVIGDVLQTTNHLPLVDGQLHVVLRFPGQVPITKAELYHPMAHGDVISISQGASTVLKGFGSMAPIVSEWKAGGASATRDPFISEAAAPNKQRADSLEPILEPFQFPALPPDSLFLPVEGLATEPNVTAETADQGETPVADLQALTVSQSEDVADGEKAEDSLRLTSESTTVAPIAPLEVEVGPVTALASTGFNAWNLVFIGGLLLAGTLILAGTLKPDPDDNTEFSARVESVAHFDAIPALARNLTAVSRPPSITRSATKPAEPAAGSKPGIEPEAVSESAERLVARYEWFSSDWQGELASSESQHDGASSGALKSLASSSNDGVKDVVELCHDKFEARPRAQAQAAELVASAVQDQSSAISGAAMSADKHRQKATETASPQTKTSPEVSFSDLEDLLQNRLPIELCETQLPLHITLFGRPAGPQRLRIDAAHPSVPAPHMNLSADKRRGEPVAAAAAAPQPATVAGSSGSLDRALHFLQERTDP